MPKFSLPVPPPCWTDEETRALIVAYRDRWFSANRGSLRSADWAAIAMSVSSIVGLPPKTAVQCQHKVEKLRRRYREEKRKLLESPQRFSSAWELFPLLDSMDIGSFGSNPASRPVGKDGRFLNRSDDISGIRLSRKHNSEPNIINNANASFKATVNDDIRSTAFDLTSRLGEMGNNVEGTRFGDSDLFKDENDCVGSMEELARAIMMSAESFVKVEEMKMEVATEMERMRMEMELQRDKMMLDLQVMVVNSIANSLADFDDLETKTKLKRKRKSLALVPGDFSRPADGHRDASNGSGGISDWGKRGKRG